MLREAQWKVGAAQVVFTPPRSSAQPPCLFSRGMLRWPDGRTYTGTFKNGLEDG